MVKEQYFVLDSVEVLVREFLQLASSTLSPKSYHRWR